MSGWFAISREMLDNPIFNGRPDRVYAWIWLLGAAAYKDTAHDVQGVIVPVKRGQICASQQTISRGCGMSRQALRTFLTLCQRHGMICAEPATKATKSKTILTICNYGKYQGPQPSDQPSSNQAATKYQPNINQQKEQGNKGTREQDLEDTSVSLPLVPTDDQVDFVKEAISLFKESAQRSGWPIPRVLSQARRASLKARLKECGGIEGWKVALGKAEASGHCCGRNDRGWVLNFDFITSPSGFTKLMEGNYDNRSNGQARPTSADATTRAIATAARARRTPGENLF